MRQIDNMPIAVTGEERRHPAIRLLARACIAIARRRLETQHGKPEAAQPTPVQEGEDA